MLGVSVDTINRAKKIATMPTEWQELVETGKVSVRTARAGDTHGNQFYGEKSRNLLGAVCEEHLTHILIAPQHTNAQKPSRTGRNGEQDGHKAIGQNRAY